MTTRDKSGWKIAVVIPCFREKDHVLDVIKQIPENVDYIFCVDDACPEQTGEYIKTSCQDPRVKVIRHDTNQGVGGAMVSGYQEALKTDVDIVVKIDGDGQMDPLLIHRFIKPIINGTADYTKGNRFYRPDDVISMPKVRLGGNAILSFMNKLSTGYWQLFDPNNGFTAIHTGVLRLLQLDKISKSYFFESDMLFRLNTLRATVIDVPMQAVYKKEKSSMSIPYCLFEFAFRHTRNFFKRIFYNYFLRDFHIASIEWILGPCLFLFGVLFGSVKWLESIQATEEATAGTVMLAALPVIIGLQLTLSALSFDIDNTPRTPLHLLLDEARFSD